MIHITDPAQEYLASLLAKQKSGTQIRMFVNNPCTIEAECGIAYCFPDEINNNDIELKFKYFSIFLEKESSIYLDNAKIDITFNKFGSEIILKAPNAKMKDISPDASLKEKIEYMLHSEINTKLLAHGGRVSLIDVTQDMIAILKFEGGCNGCSMIEFTLENEIKKKILTTFPQIQGIRDSTQHNRGSHSYF
ncbi:NifU family protein [Candidatus Schneideria nysicola]|uniref:NifU family protein n=1 Tax=Candidatus Schneideria nysicola TaxID=1081631 RepID=UPI001CAA5B30|nr:NifU family protein [Candidatus Schneideria nysicola]UAJ65822.1 NifU family protein [Candidatus Schneideria nysicola]UAJ66355.1 NifU family protein [Candidatus Schneideria nysicola]